MIGGELPASVARAVLPGPDLSKLDPAALKRNRERALARAGALKPPITRVLPVARALEIGGRALVVEELRLADLAELQAWLEGQVPHPLDGLPPAWADPEPDTRLGRLGAAWEASATWPPRLGSDEGARLLASRQGHAFFVLLAARRRQPGFGLAEALELVDRATPAEWAGLVRSAYAIHPRLEIAAELAPDLSPGGGSDWCRSLHRAAEVGNSYPELAEMTVGQWRNTYSEGKAAELSPEFAATSRRVRQALNGEGRADG